MSRAHENISGARAEAIGETAARWVLRRKEGLSLADERELAAWEAADPRHAAALAERAQAWARFEPLVPQSGTGIRPVLRPGRDARATFRVAVLAAAAALVLGLFVHAALRPSVSLVVRQKPPLALPAPCERLALADGSEVELNRSARVRAAFTATERRVHLETGEANFIVAKDAARPFIVIGNGVEVRAVGTVFNVRLGPAAEILVTEGAVRVTPPQQAPVALSARQRIVVAKDTTATPRVETLSDAEIAADLAWQPQMLDFDDVPLSAVAAEFNRHNPIRLVIADPAIAALRMNGTFRSDNVAGFARLLERNYDIRFERGGAEGVIRLRR